MPPECDHCLTHHTSRERCRLKGVEDRLRERVRELHAKNERLREQLDEAQLRSIEARNPGIDIEQVKRIRAGR